MVNAHLRYRDARRITLIGAFVNTVLAIIKIIFGLTGKSHALIADGIHSFSDLLTDGLVILASRYGSQAADSDHPYGHRRIETAATVAVSILLILAGIGIIFDAGYTIIFSAQAQQPNAYVLFVAALSICFKETLYHYTKHVATRLGSKLLQVNAWHHRSDAAASIVVLIGVSGALVGFARLDAIAAIIIGLMIIKMGWKQGWSSMRELVDTGIDEETLSAITKIITQVPGVKTLHQLRTRSMGNMILLDVHILVNPYVSVSEGHFIGQQVHFKLIDEFAEIHDVTVHVDAEDDEAFAPSSNLPTRDELIPLLQQRWEQIPEAVKIQYISLHYLSGKLHLEIYLPASLLTTNAKENLLASFQQAVADFAIIASIKLWFG